MVSLMYLDHPRLNLSSEEKRVFAYLFQQADSEKIGVVTGEDAVKFFERTKLPANVLGEVGASRYDHTSPGLIVDRSYRSGRSQTQITAASSLLLAFVSVSV